jgi:DNA-binding beta-propeller fold protein YncE
MWQMRSAGAAAAGRLALLCLAGLLPAPVLAHPGSGIVVDRLGQVYFVDTGSGLWKIDVHGALIRIAAPMFHWLTLDADDRFGSVQLPSGSRGEITRVGSTPTLLLGSDFPLSMGRDGNLYYPSRAAGGGLDILRLLPSGRSSVLTSLPLRHLNGIAAAPDGSLYYTENNAIRRISAQGKVSTVAADIAVNGCASIPGTDSNDPLLRGLTVDASGTVYVAASGCGSVLKVTSGGQITTLLQLKSPWSPTAVALFGRDLYVLEYLHTAIEDRRQWLPRVRKISPDGKTVIVATVSRR